LLRISRAATNILKYISSAVGTRFAILKSVIIDGTERKGGAKKKKKRAARVGRAHGNGGEKRMETKTVVKNAGGENDENVVIFTNRGAVTIATKNVTMVTDKATFVRALKARFASGDPVVTSWLGGLEWDIKRLGLAFKPSRNINDAAGERDVFRRSFFETVVIPALTEV